MMEMMIGGVEVLKRSYTFFANHPNVSCQTIIKQSSLTRARVNVSFSLFPNHPITLLQVIDMLSVVVIGLRCGLQSRRHKKMQPRVVSTKGCFTELI